MIAEYMLNLHLQTGWSFTKVIYLLSICQAKRTPDFYWEYLRILEE